jgi:hypothetical protein
MVDYRKFEQPMWMESGGLLGRSVGTLKNFVNNQANQLVYYAQQARKGNVSPLAALLGVQYLMAGTMGMQGVETVSTVYDDLIRPMLGPEQADKSMKLWLLENQNDLMKYGGLSALTGMNMFGSLSQGNLGGVDSVGSAVAPFMEDVIKTGKATASAFLDPTNPDKWRTALYENLPPHGKGMMENLDPNLTTDQGVSINPRNPEQGMYQRSDVERRLRNIGATSIEEYSTKEMAFERSKRERNIQEAKSKLKADYVAAARQGNQKKQEEIAQQLLKWMGPDEASQFLIQGMMDAAESRTQDVTTRGLPRNLNSVEAIRKYQRMRGIND